MINLWFSLSKQRMVALEKPHRFPVILAILLDIIDI